VIVGYGVIIIVLVPVSTNQTVINTPTTPYTIGPSNSFQLPHF
jgi:hypothetical protein